MISKLNAEIEKLKSKNNELIRNEEAREEEAEQLRQSLADVGTKHAENVQQLKSYQSYLEQKHAETVTNL